MRLDLSNLRQTEHLEPPAVREDRSGPVDEFVQPARLRNDVHAWANVEMVSVPEDDLRAHLDQLAWINRFAATLRAHRHINRRINNAMSRGQSSQARFRVRVRLQKFKHRRHVVEQVAVATNNFRS
jgi:hypothetical protein